MPINWAAFPVISVIEQLENHPWEEFSFILNTPYSIPSLEHQVLLSYELSNLKHQMDVMCYAALDILASDTNGLDLAEYRKWVGRFNTVESDYLLADLHIASGEFPQAYTHLYEMRLKYPDMDTVVHQHYLDYVAVVEECF